MRTSPILIVAVAVSVTLGACSSGSDAEPESNDPDGTEAPESDESDDVVADTVALTPLSADDDEEVRNTASPFYASVTPDRIVVGGSQPVGASECELITTWPGNPEFDSPLHLIRPPGGELMVQDLVSFDDVMQTCFYTVGLEPTTADIVTLTTTMTSHFLSITALDSIPPEVVAELSDLADDPDLLDFNDYSGPVEVEDNGSPAVRFVAEDRIRNWYVVTSIASPEFSEVVSVSVVYVG